MGLDTHPTVVAWRARPARESVAAESLNADWLRALCLECGADDAGFVEAQRDALGEERKHVIELYPKVKSLISIVVRMNRGPGRAPARSVANVEFHRAGHEVNDVAARLVRRLEAEGIGAVNPPMAFPMEARHWPRRMWTVSHKPVAVEAGMGHMGIHRSVIHPTFGSFILLGTIVIDRGVSAYGRPLDYNPCVECKLCVAACPVGAIGSDGHFDLSACYTHNYREFMGGFGDWVEQVAESRGRNDYRARVSPAETVSMWQSLGFGPNYKSGNCVAVCPAGEDVIGPFLSSRASYLEDVVKPLQNTDETVYVVPGTDAEAHVLRRFPHKHARNVRANLVPRDIDGFLHGMRITFQRGAAAGLSAVYHFRFTGKERNEATVVIGSDRIDVREGLHETPDLVVTADAATWLGFLAREKSLIWALITRKIRLKGNPRLLVRFGRCFPSA
jgi:ferredoxin